MVDYHKFQSAQYMSKRMYILKIMSEDKGVTVEYVFGLLNLYNDKNKGRWFWQKAKLGGSLRETFEKFNNEVDHIINSVKRFTEEDFKAKIPGLSETFEKLLEELESNLNVNRQEDRGYVTSLIDDNLKKIIDDSLAKL